MIDVNDFLSFQVHGSAGGHKAGDGIAGGVEALLTFLEGLVGLEPSEMFFAIFPGISAMANIHPVLVHFPIAFILSFFIIDLVGSIINNDNWRRLAAGLLYLGVISAAAAVVAGLMAAGSVDHGENVHLIMNKHKSFGFSVLGLSIVLALWRLISGNVIKGVNNLLFLTFAALLNLLIMLGADLGGLMVYKHGVAVEAVEVTSMDYFQEHTHTH